MFSKSIKRNCSDVFEFEFAYVKWLIISFSQLLLANLNSLLNLKELSHSVLQEPIQQPYNTDEKDTDGIEKPACLEVAEIQFEALTVELALMLHSTYP